MLPAIRLYRQGYPDCLPMIEFVRRFNVLCPPEDLPASLLVGLHSAASVKQAAEILMLHVDLERTSYRLGLSQVSKFAVVQLTSVNHPSLLATISLLFPSVFSTTPLNDAEYNSTSENNY